MAEPVPEITDEEAAAPEDAAEGPDEPKEQQPEPEQPSRGARPRFDVRDFARTNARALVALALFVVGIVFIVLAWYGAAYTNILTEQIPYLISGGLLGLGLIIVAGILASSALHERENEELRRDIVRALNATQRGGPAVSAEQASPNGHPVFVVPGGRSYHFAGCPILEGKEGVKELQPAQATSSGYAACKLCGPD